MLPVELLLPEIIAQLKSGPGLIICAPPGSGKTTKVAPALIDAGLCDPKRRTLLLQPRRVAARATAQRIADERKVRIGEEVGYRVRFDSKTSDRTSLVVATEGILVGMISQDPTLDGVGTVILDEFHERSLNADLLLSMLHQIQQLVRDDLNIVVMSATLDAKPLEDYLHAPSIVSDGTLHPVDIKYRPSKFRQPLKEHVTESVQHALANGDGDILVFLPGVGEILQVERELSRTVDSSVELLSLYGSMPLDQQQRVLISGQRRRVILSTNVAETSLTIEGIRCVIDSGLARVLRFDPAVGIDRLQLEPICKSSATQRAGRAGRLSAGTCIRLWDEKSQNARAEFHEPEVRRVDLSSAILRLYNWGEQPKQFPWFEAPHAESIAAADRLLVQLGAVENGRITPVGRRMSKLPTTPRLARMLVATDKPSEKYAVAFVAAMLGERDPFMRDSGRNSHRHSTPSRRWDCDISQRVIALRDYFERGVSDTPFGTVHRGAARNIQRIAKQLAGPNDQNSSTSWPNNIEEFLPKALLQAFPDRLAKRRKPGEARGLMVGGKGVRLAGQTGVTAAELFLCIDIDGKGSEAMVRQASSISRDWLPKESINEKVEMFFNPTRKCVDARARTYWIDLLLNERTSQIQDREGCRELLFHEAKKNLSLVLPDKKSKFHAYWTRLQCLAEWAPDLKLPPANEQVLIEVLHDLCFDKRSFAELQAAPWIDWLKSKLSATQQQAVDSQCPERIEVPSGNQLQINYTPGKPPVLEVRIQEVFSWTETPRVAFGKVPILLHLLAPNFRPQQVTDDLASFWENTYEVVRKELRRRYPKHSWPEDPLTAKPESKGGRRRN